MILKLPQAFFVNYDHRMSRPKIPETPQQAHERRAFAVLVRMFRGVVGWSQQELADQLGLSKASIAKLELGTMRFSPENNVALVRLMRNKGVKFVFDKGDIDVHVEKRVVVQLDPNNALSLPLSEKSTNQ